MRQHYVMNSVMVQRKEHNETALCHEFSGGAEERTQWDRTMSWIQWWCRGKNTMRQHYVMNSVVVQRKEHN